MLRRYFILLVLFISLIIFNAPASSQSNNITLDKPKSSINVDLMTAYQLRKSTKSFLTKEISMGDLSTILWAANGINRENGKRTSPSAYGKYYMEIYVVSDNGVYIYDVPKHELGLITGENIKMQIANQTYVGEASHVLVLTTNLSKFHPLVKEEAKIPASFATAGFIGQNIYLLTNALNLGASFVVGIKQEVIKEKLKLKDDEIPLCVMPIGYPKN